MKDRGIIMNCEQACAEMNFILNNLDLKDLEKIPKGLVRFFEENMDKSYKVNIDLNKPLYEQNLLEETKAFIKIIDLNYFTSKENRARKIAQLDLDDKSKNDGYDNIFQNKNISSIDISKNATEESNDQNSSLVQYKEENRIIKFLKNLLNKFFKKT